MRHTGCSGSDFKDKFNFTDKEYKDLIDSHSSDFEQHLLTVLLEKQAGKNVKDNTIARLSIFPLEEQRQIRQAAFEQLSKHPNNDNENGNIKKGINEIVNSEIKKIDPATRKKIGENQNQSGF